MRRPRPLWLDCDPGHDDALAIVLAAHSPDLIDLLGVSTVASNHELGAVTGNAAAVLASINATRTTRGSGSGGRSSEGTGGRGSEGSGVVVSVPLHAGAASPLLVPRKACPEIHGSSGLCVSGGSFADVVARRLRERGKEHLLVPACSRKGAVEAMAVAIEKASEELERERGEGRGRGRRGERDEAKVAVVATGALTNIALLLWTRPDLVEKFDLYLMGGAMGQGNTGVVAEFNFEVDPHAAAAVFGFGEGTRGDLSITMVPLEVTHTALVTPSVLSVLGLGRRPSDGGDGGGSLSPLREALRSVLLYFAETYASHFGFDVGPPLHDPLAVLAAVSPGCFSLSRARVDVETCSHLSMGQSVVDLRPELGRSSRRGKPNAWVATAVDLDVLWGALSAAIERADAASPL